MTGHSEQEIGAAGRERARSLLIGLIAFLTVIDLFAAQAILPALVETYAVKPAAMGFAVNASTMGMAAAGLGVALLSHRIDRRRGIVASLVLLALPTTLLALAPDLPSFTALRIAQGLCMATAFTLTLAYLGEHCGPRLAATAFAAYITGNVASNLFGRLLAAVTADHLGLAPSFLALAALNLLGAGLVHVGLTRGDALTPMPLERPSALAALVRHGRNPRLLGAFAIGFCILFAFIGTFTYVNFVLVGPPLSLPPMALGFVYLVFLPSILTTPVAGRAVARFGPRAVLTGSLGLAALSLPLLLADTLVPVLTGLALVAVGTFCAQAVATGYVSEVAGGDRGSASGLYLASYFLGGLVGSAVLGLLFDRSGWPACVAGIGAALGLAVLIAARLGQPAPQRDDAGAPALAP